MELSSRIEALLFHEGDPIAEDTLADALEVTSSELEKGIAELTAALNGRGISVIRANGAVALATAPEAAPLIEKRVQEELSRPLGKAGVETLTIILYCGPITRPQIDYIRGVNSSYMVRHLLVRGLIERAPKERSGRSFLYRPTLSLLAELGISHPEELPDYHQFQEEMKAFSAEDTDNDE